MKRVAVLGHPVAHSRSPAMHNAAFSALGLAGEWLYEALDVRPEEFEARVRQMPAEGFVGANVTVPHKHSAIGMADRTTDRARRIGAANTLTFTGAGIEADNTDAPGFLAIAGPVDPGSRVLVLGAGGTARAVIWALGRSGAGLDVWNRTGARAAELAAELGGEPIGAEELVQAGYDMIVNCSAAGLDGEDPFSSLPVERDGFRPGQTVVDMVYGERPSDLLAAARNAGARTVDGLEMLVGQGAVSFEIWTGLEPPLEVMKAAVRA